MANFTATLPPAEEMDNAMGHLAAAALLVPAHSAIQTDIRALTVIMGNTIHLQDAVVFANAHIQVHLRAKPVVLEHNAIQAMNPKPAGTDAIMHARKKSAIPAAASGAAVRTIFNGTQQIMGMNAAIILCLNPLMLGFLQVKEGLYAIKAYGMPLLRAGQLLQLHTALHAAKLAAFILMVLYGCLEQQKAKAAAPM
jgi:hypothetical protein